MLFPQEFANFRKSTHNLCEEVVFVVSLSVFFDPHSSEIPGAHMVCPSLSVAISNLETPPLSDNIETVFAFGGSSVYSVSPRNLAK